ncbi:MAG: T9SS type A sorting domain-containing protein [Candidatus Eisenbacteria bacterium]|nr:T9SS type A sorting domain-containing protein [Candidatus Eisenbacteria bacterium]
MRLVNRCASTFAFVACLAVAGAGTPSWTHAQGFSIKRGTIGGGGATGSSGGAFSLSGTIGQPEAGALTGGPYTVHGGCWVTSATTALGVPDPPAVLQPDLLSAPRPNPFGTSTEVAFALARPGHARLEVYDLAGQRVRSFMNGAQAAGTFRVNWNGDGDDGRHLAAGVYFFRLETDVRRTSRRVVLLH